MEGVCGAGCVLSESACCLEHTLTLMCLFSTGSTTEMLTSQLKHGVELITRQDNFATSAESN